MKNIIFTILAVISISINMDAQDKSTVIKSNFEITKKVDAVIDTDGNVNYVKSTLTVYAHLKQQSFGGAGNIVECWLEFDGERYYYKMLEDVTIAKMKDGSYSVFDSLLCHFMLMTNGSEWCASFNTREMQ